MTLPEPVSVACALVIYVRELARSAHFYREVLGLVVVEDADTWQVLTGPGLELVIHQVPPEIAVDIHIERPPALREDTPLKPVFTVEDLAILRAAILATGGGLEEEDAVWTWRGYHIIDGWDPEGNILQFRWLERPDTTTEKR
jgi:catechol 2,3-dioxygenase-like lactoylglutathione lyase family enzyme